MVMVVVMVMDGSSTDGDGGSDGDGGMSIGLWYLKIARRLLLKQQQRTENIQRLSL